MGRFTVYNNITTPEKIAAINPENVALMNDFLEYLDSVGRAQSTIKNYRSDLLIFFCWCEDNLGNKSFVELTKRELVRFQSHAVNEWKWSPCRVRTVKATLSSLSNYIENILDDDYKGYKPIVRKIESPPKQAVREKTVYSDEEIKALLDELVRRKEYEKACFVALGAYSERRKSELLRFRVDDFDEDKLVCDGALYRSAPIKTKGRGGGKYIPCYTLAKKFKPYFDLWMEEREKRGIKSEWLFPKRDDPREQLATSSVDNWCNEFSKITGKTFYVHSLRHAMTTSLSKAGIPDSVIQTIICWESADMVRLYNDRTDDELISEYFKNGDIAAPQSKGLGNLK